jgi:hypothetical protein
MTDAQKNVREYLSRIGQRGGFTSRRDLTKSHARQMLAIREMKRATLKAGQALATARSQIAQTAQAHVGASPSY